LNRAADTATAEKKTLDMSMLVCVAMDVWLAALLLVEGGIDPALGLGAPMDWEMALVGTAGEPADEELDQAEAAPVEEAI
jgi:hypothetical protein